MKYTIYMDPAKLPYIQAQHIPFIVLENIDRFSAKVEIEIRNESDLINLIYAGVKYGMDTAFQNMIKVA